MFKRVIELWENNVFIQRGRYGLPPLQLQKSSILWGQRWISVSFLNVLFLLIHYTKKAQQQTSITAHAQPCAVKLVTCHAFVRPWIWLWITSSLCLSPMQFEEKKIRRKLKANPLLSHSFPYFETFRLENWNVESFQVHDELQASKRTEAGTLRRLEKPINHIPLTQERSDPWEVMSGISVSIIFFSRWIWSIISMLKQNKEFMGERCFVIVSC